jgi:hypothetical protein
MILRDYAQMNYWHVYLMLWQWSELSVEQAGHIPRNARTLHRLEIVGDVAGVL